MKNRWAIYKIACILLIFGMVLCLSPSQTTLTKGKEQDSPISLHSNGVSSLNDPKTSTTVSSIKFCSFVKTFDSYTEQDDALFSPNTRLFIYIEIYDAFRHQLTISITVTAPDGSSYMEETIKESPLTYDYAKWWEKDIDLYDWNGEYRVQIEITDKSKDQIFVKTGSFFVRDAAPLIAITMEDLPVQMGVSTYHRIKVNLYNLDPSFCGTSTITIRLVGSAFDFPDGNAKGITLGPNERRDVYFTVIPNSFGVKTLRVEILFMENIISYEDYSISVTIGYLYAIPIVAVIGLIMIYFYKRSKPAIQIPETQLGETSSSIEYEEIETEETTSEEELPKRKREPSYSDRTLTKEKTPFTTSNNFESEDTTTRKYFELDDVAKDTHKKLIESLIRHKKDAEGIKLPKIEKKILKKEILCSNCGNLMPEETSICPACRSDEITCPVCLQPIIFGEPIIKCSNCGVFAHEDHYLRWITTKGYCPKCKTPIRDLD